MRLGRPKNAFIGRPGAPPFFSVLNPSFLSCFSFPILSTCEMSIFGPILKKCKKNAIFLHPSLTCLFDPLFISCSFFWKSQGLLPWKMDYVFKKCNFQLKNDKYDRNVELKKCHFGDFLPKSDFWAQLAIFGIFVIFWHVGVHFPNNFGVQFLTFSNCAIFAILGHFCPFLGGVRGSPYSFFRFLAIFDTSATQNDRFFSRFFTFFNYPSSPGAIGPWAWQKWHFLKMPKKTVIFWKCTFGHFWPFWQILADFGSFLDPWFHTIF